MIDESRRRERQLGDSSSPSAKHRKRKRRSSPSPTMSSASTGSSRHTGSSSRHGRGDHRSSRRSNGSVPSRNGSSAAGGDGGSVSRFGGGPPRLSATEFTTMTSLERRQQRVADDAMTATTRSSRSTIHHESETNSSHNGLVRTPRDAGDVVWSDRSRRRCRCRCRCLEGPCASGSALVVVGCLLVAIGVIRLLVCYWHETGSAVWAGIPLLLFGFSHIILSQRLTTRTKRTVYFVLGAVTSLVVLAAAAVSLVLVVPTLGQVVTASSGQDNNVDSLVLASVNFTKYSSERTVTGVVPATWPSVVLDLCSLLLLAVSLHAQTITATSFDNQLDVIIDDGIGDWPTSSTKRRRAFRPVDQMTVGQATIFVGFFEVTFIEYLQGHDTTTPHAWSVVWSGALLIAAGLISMFGDKMTFSKTVAILCMVLELLSLLGCAATTVLTTLALAKDAQRLKQIVNGQSEVSNVAAMVTVEALSDCLSVVGIVYSVGLLFRHSTRLCRCTTAVDQPRSAGGGSPSSSRTGTVSGRRTMADWRPSHQTEMYSVGTGQTE